MASNHWGGNYGSQHIKRGDKDKSWWHYVPCSYTHIEVVMRAFVIVILLFVATTSTCDAQAEHMSAPISVQTRIGAIVSGLRSGEIVRVEILQIPPGVETRTRVTPDILERTYDYKLIIRDLRGGAHSEGLRAAVASTSIAPSTDLADLRWGLIFLDNSGQRVGALYLDASGRFGVVDSVAVSFRGGLSEWLNSNFSHAFR
jgi:hypothetical protein